MSISLLIAGIVLGGIFSLVCLIFAILSLVWGKQSNAIAWGVGFLISVFMLCYSIYKSVSGVVNKVHDGVEWAQDQPIKLVNKIEKEMVANRQAWLDTMQAYTREDITVPADFYANKPAEHMPSGNKIIPFIYPYSVSYDNKSFLGDLMVASRDSVFLRNISAMAFDQNFVIAKVDNTNSKDLLQQGRGEIEYILFDMRTGEFENMTSMEQLLKISDKIGYTGPKELKYLSTSLYCW